MGPFKGSSMHSVNIWSVKRRGKRLLGGGGGEAENLSYIRTSIREGKRGQSLVFQWKNTRGEKYPDTFLRTNSFLNIPSCSAM
jgi:hypothetical protein